MSEKMTERGGIKNRVRNLQGRDYTRMRWGKITPTDIDGLLDFQNKAFVLIELQCPTKIMTYGQRTALSRLCDNLRKPAIVIIAEHNTLASQDIAADEAWVVERYYKGKWARPIQPIQLKAAIDRFLDVVGVSL